MSAMRVEGSGPASGNAATGALAIDVEDLSAGQMLLCAACEHPVTTTAARVQIAGAHVHRKQNPHGYFFTFGCFGAAPGAAGTTEPTLEATWFDGFAWSMAHCLQCRAHLGWRYESGPQRFFGLILERLIEGEP